MSLPEPFLERLRRILPESEWEAALKSFSLPKKFVVRVNTIKTTSAEAAAYLESKQISFSTVSWYPDALVLDPDARLALRGDAWIDEGRLYPQNLSSMAAPLVLDPQPGERVLDLCAAPGSKTTQMAQMMRNQGSITAVDAVHSRFFKLRAVAALTGSKIIKPMCLDGRQYRISGEKFNEPPFDRILVDAPCSSEGMFDANDPETTAYWSLRKIDEMSKKQRGLLLSASRLLRSGGTMVYSTCSFAPEENELTVDWLLKKADKKLKCVPVFFSPRAAGPSGVAGAAGAAAGTPAGAVSAVSLPIRSMKGLAGWEKRTFHPDVQNTVRILPGEDQIGFFIARFVLE